MKDVKMNRKKISLNLSADVIVFVVLIAMVVFVWVYAFVTTKVEPRPLPTVMVIKGTLDFLDDCEQPCYKGQPNHVMAENKNVRIICECLDR